MPELRKDPVMGTWVIISSERSRRPFSFQNELIKATPGLCPFCPGNESHTPPEIISYRPNGSQPNQPGWTLRVISNKYPALIVEGELHREVIGLYDKMHGVGAHEVGIETPEHNLNISEMTDEQARDVFWAYRERMLDLVKDLRLKYILVFKNQGEAAGASLEHPHSQLIATPIVPKRVMEELEGAKEYYNYKERCVFCDIIRQESTQGARMICENDDFIAIAPYAARFPFENWMMAKTHDPFFEDAQKHEYVDLSKLLRELLLRQEKVLTNPPYNLMIHNSPLRETDGRHYHWHIEVLPKLTRVAGFEWGSGFYINPTPPEEAAKYLRDVVV